MRGLALFTCAAALWAQGPASNQPPAQNQPQGLETDWEIAVTLQAIGANTEQILPMLEKIDVYKWVEKGASDTYLAQLQTSKVEARALAESAKMLAASPVRLPASLDLYLRINSLEAMLNSLQEGIRKYQSPGDAMALASLQAKDSGNRERFQRYIVELAAQREKDLEVMDHEAQRCRAIVTQAAPRPVARKK